MTLPRRGARADNVADRRNGYYDLVYSPDDGGWFARLLFDRAADPPIFDCASGAELWARKHGGKLCLSRS